MDTFQGYQQRLVQGFQHGVDTVFAPYGDAMTEVFGEEAMDTAWHATQVVEALPQQTFHATQQAAEWVGTHVTDVMSRITRPRVNISISFGSEDASSTPYQGWTSNAVSYAYPVYSPTVYNVLYQSSPMMFFSAIDYCWQMGINPFLNTQMLFQILMMMWMNNFMMCPFLAGAFVSAMPLLPLRFPGFFLQAAF